MFLFDLICRQFAKNVLSIVKNPRHLSPWSIAIGTIMVFSLTSCYDIGDRDNPLDPGAANYVAYEETSSSSSIKASSSSTKATSSSSIKTSSSSTRIEKQSSSSKKGSSSSKKVSSSSAKATSSSSVVKSSSSKNVVVSSSSKVTKPAEVSSSSKNVSSSSAKVNSSSSVVKSSSSKNVIQSSSDKATSSSTVSSASHSSSSTKQSSSSWSGVIVSSSSKLNEVSSSSDGSWACGTSPLVRDGVEYKTVVIKEKCFTKENLRYLPKAGGNTMCYGNDSANCKIYGLLYDFEAASLACPTGWRLPTSAEYIEMQDYSGDDMYDAGKHFKATSGWTTENGDDFLEFTALPGGYCDDDGCVGIGSMGYWWTSTEKVKNASHLTLFLNGDGGAFTAEKKMDNDKFASVRCVKIQK